MVYRLFFRVSDILHNFEEKNYHRTRQPPRQNAVAFQCFVDNIWHKFGYAAREVTDELQEAIANNLIQYTQFKAVRYFCTWSQCAPGFYVAVYIAKSGVWSQSVVRAKSTL